MRFVSPRNPVRQRHGENMSEITLFGFPRSVYVQMAGLVLTHKEVPYKFHDLEQEMGGPTHLALHPFDRCDLRHGDFTLYETSAIAAYIDEAFDGPKLTPAIRSSGTHEPMISAVNAYYYPYLIYHVSHERNVFPQLGVPSDEKVVAHALPKVEICLQVLERELSGGKAFLLGPQLTLADFYMLPIIHAFGFTPEAQAMYPKFRRSAPGGNGWSPADPEAVSRRAAAARSDRTCAKMGCLPPPKY